MELQRKLAQIRKTIQKFGFRNFELFLFCSIEPVPLNSGATLSNQRLELGHVHAWVLAIVLLSSFRTHMITYRPNTIGGFQSRETLFRITFEG